ncbi:hypothetical protein B7494_g801 [Chlorociboria aeruginascens]|nr:hypothetical protein B7494_g801 [Chlorociboria aeruginascens]
MQSTRGRNHVLRESGPDTVPEDREAALRDGDTLELWDIPGVPHKPTPPVEKEPHGHLGFPGLQRREILNDSPSSSLTQRPPGKSCQGIGQCARGALHNTGKRAIVTIDQIWRRILSKLPYSKEAQEAKKLGRGYASALRQIAKRRIAYSDALPFTVATIGVADEYLYHDGILCYTLGDRIRILDLHNSGHEEVVISIPALLSHISLDVGDQSVFQVLYCSDDIISAIYEDWLIAFNIKSKEILLRKYLEFTEKIFVRHNGLYLYYGTHSELGTFGIKKWVMHGYQFKTRKWFPDKINLPELVGTEIGSTICFRFHQDYFYALSNQTSFEVEEIDWTSFYHCFRFPLASPCNELLEKTENKQMWRRQHLEGPIDDRWTSLGLDINEVTEEIQIIEIRKEWPAGASRSQRSVYTTPIIFPKREDQEIEFLHSPAPSFTSTSTTISPSCPSTSQSTTPTIATSITFASASTSTATTMATTTTATATAAKLLERDLSHLPNDPILRLLRDDDHPHYIQPPPRIPWYTHPSNRHKDDKTFTIYKTPMRYYNASTSTYLDLVNDPRSDDWRGTPRLRLRAGSRRLGPPLTYSSGHKRGLLRQHSEDLMQAIDELYRHSEIIYWPPEEPEEGYPAEDLAKLYQVLNPPNHAGNVNGVADERSFVYATGEGNGPKALVFVGFDAKVKLAGLKKWGGPCKKGLGEGPHIEGRATGHAEKQIGIRNQNMDEANRTLELGVEILGESKGKEKERMPDRQYDWSSSGTSSDAGNNWVWTEQAMYCHISRGYNFCY